MDDQQQEQTTAKEENYKKKNVDSNNDDKLLFSGPPSRRRAPIPELECCETIRDDEDVGKMIVFQCKVPSSSSDDDETTVLEFNCRDSSNGVLVKDFQKETHTKGKLLGQVDHHFFDPGYTLAASTGFQIWPGSRMMTEALCWPSRRSSRRRRHNNDCSKLQGIQQALLCCGTNNVLELGAGIGMVGIALAAALGVNVLQTDLATLTDNAIYPNQLLNQTRRTMTINDDDECPPFLQHYKDYAVPIHGKGGGWAATTPLDWTKPLNDQIPTKVLSQIDFIVGCDCLWLQKMQEPILSQILQGIFDVNPKARFLLTYQRRDPNSVFTTLESILEKLQHEYQWNYDCLAWRSVHCGNDKNDDDDDDKDDDDAADAEEEEDNNNDLYLFEIVPKPPT